MTTIRPPRLTRSGERNQRSKRMKLNNFFPPNNLSGGPSLLNELVISPDIPLIRNLDRRFSLNHRWNPYRNCKTPTWKTLQVCPPPPIHNRRRPRNVKVR